MKIKVTLKQIFILIIAVILIFGSIQIYHYVKPIRTIYYRGIPFSFRDDIRKANKISVYPDEQVLYNIFWNSEIKNIMILFKPGDSKTNALYQVEAFELTYKLTKIENLNPSGVKKTFNAQPINTYENITREEGTLKIILVAPEFANETYVKAEGSRIYIYAKDNKGFDLATMKTILSVMNVTVVDSIHR